MPASFASLPSAIQQRIGFRSDGCWVWTGYRHPNGYGHFGPRFAHRVVYERLIGSIPQGMQIDHLCQVKLCVNPTHMEVVTHRVNTLRGNSQSAIHARQTHCIHGHPFSGSNLRINPDGSRRCRQCAREAARRAWAKHRRAAMRTDEGEPVCTDCQMAWAEEDER